MNPEDKLIVALDTSSKEDALKIVDALGDSVVFYKVGLELFSNSGPSVVKEIKDRNKKIFFDGKFFDIPNTVSSAVKNILSLGVDILNVHTLGGKKMMQDAVSVIRDHATGNTTRIIGVTILTSTSQEELNKEIKIDGDLEKHVLFRAKLAKESGLDGVVASPKEASLIRKEIGNDFLIVTPGIRPSWSVANDQKRITTPKEAIQQGASHIVVGRPITKANDLKEAANKVIEEIKEGLLSGTQI